MATKKKPRAGRPTIPANERKQPKSATMHPEIIERVEKAADQLGMGFGPFLEQAADRYADEVLGNRNSDAGDHKTDPIVIDALTKLTTAVERLDRKLNKAIDQKEQEGGGSRRP